ncbi:hypothetical protein M9H77_09264 [Catharanthus roseus]|uniref:Uncharacterized protein n=1 Tax=Catharanthus roseus TaxID=4058 RepID=A0ACC0C0G0_CATRO|nr:hypothetical protein M9H77_09264 [Catharanthus roseus]
MHKILYNSRYIANTKCSKHQGNTDQVYYSDSSSLFSSSTFISSCPSLPSSSSSLFSLSSYPPLTNISFFFFFFCKIFPAPMGSPAPTKLSTNIRVIGFDRWF